MSRRSIVVRVLAMLYVLVNLGGMVYAAVMGEVIHTAVHGGLLVLAGYVFWRRSPRRVASY